MKKWLLILAVALLLHAGCGKAEEIFYTNNGDAYYHADPDCDRPPEGGHWGRESMDFYERACFRKYEISEHAALAFDRAACPVCVKKLEPVYLGEHMPEWQYDADPWGIGEKAIPIPDTPEEFENYKGWGTEAYREEISDTYARFEAYYEEIYDHRTGEYARRHPYPDFYAGVWLNNADGYSYAVVDPTQEMLDAFKRLFGGGAWIVPAKYGLNEMRALQDEVFEIVNEWCTQHPEFDIQPNLVSVDEFENYLGIGLYGEDWNEALPVLDAEVEMPLWVYYFRSSEITWI